MKDDIIELEILARTFEKKRNNLNELICSNKFNKFNEKKQELIKKQSILYEDLLLKIIDLIEVNILL